MVESANIKKKLHDINSIVFIFTNISLILVKIYLKLKYIINVSTT